MWHWTWILLVACFLFAGYIARWLFLSLFARFLGIQEVKIQTLHALGLGGISNLEWEGNEVTWDNAQDRQELLQRSVVTVKRIKPHTDRDVAANKRFIGILVEGVTVKVPKAHLAHQFEKLQSRKHKSKDQKKQSPPLRGDWMPGDPLFPPAATSQTRRHAFGRALARALLLTFRYIRSLVFRRLLFGVRFVDVQIVIQDVAQLDLNMSVGVQHVDTVRCLNAPVEAYFAVSELALSDVLPSNESSAKTNSIGPAAFELPRTVWLGIRTSEVHKVSLWNIARGRIAPRSFKIDLKFPEQEILRGARQRHESHSASSMSDIFIQVDKILALHELVQKELRKALPKTKHSSVNPELQEQRRHGFSRYRRQKLSPMHYLNAVSVYLPSIECHYAPPQFQEHLVLRSKLTNVRFNASLGEVFPKASSRDQIVGLEDGHRRYVGSSDTVPLAFQSQWDSWIWDLQTPSSSGSHLETNAASDFTISQLRMGQLKLAVTLNFAPWHQIEELQERIICEARLKSSYLDVHHETVEYLCQSVLPLLSSKKKSAQPMQIGKASNGSSKPLPPAVNLWPRLLFHADIDQSYMRLFGPNSTSGTSSSSSDWTAAQQLSLKTPTFSISADSEYRFLSVPLTKKRLREAQEAAEHHKRNSHRRRSSQPLEAETTSEANASRYGPGLSSARVASLFRLEHPTKSTFKDSTANLEEEVAFDPYYSAAYEASFSVFSSHPMELSMETLLNDNSSGVPSSRHTEEDGSTSSSAATPPNTTHTKSHRIFSLGPIHADGRMLIPLRDDGAVYALQPKSSTVQLDGSLGRIEFALWQHATLSFFESMSNLIAKSPSSKNRSVHQEAVQSPSQDLLDQSHPLLRAFSKFSTRCYIEKVIFEACGQDAQRDSNISRGLILLVNDLCLGVDAARQWAPDATNSSPRLNLQLSPGCWSTASEITAAEAGDGLAVAEACFSRLTVQPVLDADATASEVDFLNENLEELPAYTLPRDFLETYSGGKPPDDWEYLGRQSFTTRDSRSKKEGVNKADNRVVTVASTTVRSILRHAAKQAAADEAALAQPQTKVHFNVKSTTIAISFKLFHVYCCLASASSLKRIVDISKTHSPRESTPKSPKPSTETTWSLELPQLFLHMTFQEACELHFHAKNIDGHGPDTSLTFDFLHAAAPSATTYGQWNTLLELQDCHLRIPKNPVSTIQDQLIKLNGHSLRLRIPYKYQLWQLVDHVVSNVKACKQIYYELILDHRGSVLEPQEEGPKLLPRIECAMHEVVLEAEDDPMENRLNLARRVGTFEVHMRQERLAALDERDQHRYHLDPEDANALYERAQEHLRRFDASEWIRRFRNALAEQSKREQQLLHKLQGKHGPDIKESPLPLAPSNKECPLARATFTGFDLKLRAPTFFRSAEGVKDFLYEVGGMPKDRPLFLSVPLQVHWTVSDAKINLRDYPLPLLRIPRSPPSHTNRGAAWDFKSDIVIAEQVPAPEAVRMTVEELIPATKFRKAHLIHVPRSGMPTQMYGRPHIHLASQNHVTFGWGNSMQPALSDVARVVDSLSKPSPDPSPRIGFWDKLPLVLHGNLTVTSDADLHLHLKGSRDPYALSGAAAGFVKIWKGDVKLLLNHENESKELVQILSDKYVLAVPNLEYYDDAAAAGLDFSEKPDVDATSRHAPPETWKGVAPDVKIHKTLGVLVNGVRWGMGFRFERTCARGRCQNNPPCEGNKFQRKCRFFDFKPHYDVKTRIDPGPKNACGKIKDSFEGFRSDFVHFSLSLVSPIPDRAPPSGRMDSASNGLRLAPLMDQHFWRWWSLFDSSLSLPIRTGKAFRSPEPAPKFGRATATLKYRFDVQPFAVVHTYRQEAAVDWHMGKTTVLGMKIRFEALKIDLHQRTEEFTLQRKELGSKRIYHKKFYRAEVHGDDVDARLVTARFDNPIKSIVAVDSDFIDNANPNLDETGRETSWIDTIPALHSRDKALWENYEDFTDLGPNSLGDVDVIKVVPLMASPACTYDMQPVPLVSSHQSNLGRPAPKDSAPRSSKFGYELSHICLVGGAPKPLEIQIRSAENRIQVLETLLSKDDGETLPGADHTRAQELEKRINVLRKLRDHYRDIVKRTEHHSNRPWGEGLETLFGHTSHHDDPDFAAALLEDQANYSQKLRLHRPHIQVNTTSRDVLLKYWDSSRARKGLNYQLSASVLAQMRKVEHEVAKRKPGTPQPQEEEESSRPSQAIDHAVRACHSESWADMAAKQYEERESSNSHPGHRAPSKDAPEGVNSNWAVESQFLAIFGQPQFHVKSDTDEGSEAVITTKVAVVRTFAVSDPDADDDINSTVLHRNYGELRMVQIFYPQRDRVRALYRDEADIFVPLEVMLDGTLRYECDCLVGSTHLSMRYDKFNRLRMTNVGHAQFEEGAPEAFHQGRDEITVSVGQFEMAATHVQFAALMHIFQKLTLYTNPDRKRKNERLETARLTADYSDLKLVLRWIEEKQKTIRRLMDLLSRSDPQSASLDFYTNQAEVLYHSEQLNTFLQAMQETQQHRGGQRAQRKGDLSIRAKSSQIVLSMLQENHLPFVKAAIKDIGFNWRSQEDGSVSNQLVIGSISANNYLADAQFLEILYPVDDASLDKDFPLKGKKVVLAAMWSVLPPIGGVSVVEDLQLYLHPINLLLERRMGHLCWDYFFNAKGEVTKTAEREKSRNQSRLSDTPRSLAVPSPASAHSSTSSLAKISQSSSVTTSSNRHLRKARSQETLDRNGDQQWDEDIGAGLSYTDVQAMRERARTYRTFLRVDVPDTFIFLTYKHHNDRASWKDLFGLEFKTPHFNYANRAWSWQELANALKKDAKNHLLAQTGTLLNQAFTKARNPKNMPTPASVIKKLRNGIRTGDVIQEEEDEMAISREVSRDSRHLSLGGKPLSLASSRSRQAATPPSPPVLEDENGAAIDPSLETSPAVQRSKSEKQRYAIKSMQLADAAMDQGSNSEDESHSPQDANELFHTEMHRHEGDHHSKGSKRDKFLGRLPKFHRKSQGGNDAGRPS